MIVTRDYFEEFEMDLTGTCNLSCPLCSRNYTHAQHMVYKNVRPLEEIIKQLDTFPNLKRTFLAGQVSEPTLYPDFLDYLRYLKSRNIYIELFTNGSTRDENFWKEVAKILDESDQIHFTICGSTQELHEKYRVGSSLQKILSNAKAVRDIKPIDYCQFIRFIYNRNDVENVKKLGFTNFYIVDSEGDRFFNEKRIAEDPNIRPLENRDRLIKQVFKTSCSNNYEIRCKSIEDKKIYINQKGNISACYIHHEYEPEHIFTGESFDYTDILNFKYDTCKLCEKRIRNFIDKMELDFVC